MYRIAMISETWSDEYFKHILKGINECIDFHDVQIDVFNGYDTATSDTKQNNEMMIFSLPKPDLYDALLLSVTGFGDFSALLHTIDSFVDAGKKVVSMDRHFGRASFIGIDNYSSEYEMVLHMIKEHNCQTFAFLGGPAANEENMDRYRAFKDCLNNNGLTVDESLVRHCRFLEEDGREFYQHFRLNKIPLPDAIVCANDSMALGFIMEALKDGIECPTDYRICGFDNMEECQNYMPSITSVNRNWRLLGYMAMDMILQYLEAGINEEEKLISGAVMANESCGCGQPKDPVNEYRRLVIEKKMKDRLEIGLQETRQRLCACSSLNEVGEAIKAMLEADIIPETCLCLKENFLNGHKLENSLKENLVSYISENAEIFDAEKDPFPHLFADDSRQIYIFSTLYFRDNVFGYFLMPYVEGQYSRTHHSSVIESLGICLENIYQKTMLDKMNKKFKDLYVVDQLTGLYNRFGYTAKAGPLFSENKGRVYIVYIDLDNLKVMNDRYGHDMGDAAIKGMAACMKKVFTDTDVLVRMGGDEFLAMGRFIDAEDLESKKKALRDTMQEYAAEKNFPVKFSASIGYSYNESIPDETELEKMLKTADSEMYANKQERKRNGEKE